MYRTEGRSRYSIHRARSLYCTEGQFSDLYWGQVSVQGGRSAFWGLVLMSGVWRFPSPWRRRELLRGRSHCGKQLAGPQTWRRRELLRGRSHYGSELTAGRPPDLVGQTDRLHMCNPPSPRCCEKALSFYSPSSFSLYSFTSFHILVLCFICTCIKTTEDCKSRCA